MFIDLLSFGALFSGILVITSKNPVMAVVYLISTFINAAGYLILSGIGFVGLTYVIVYVGAITVLFLFVIMMINIKLIDILETGSQYTKNILLGIIISLLFIYEILNIIPISTPNINPIYQLYFSFLNNINHMILSPELTFENIFNSQYSVYSPETIISPFIQLQSIGQGLYTYGAIWLIISSIILLLSMVSPIFISKK